MKTYVSLICCALSSMGGTLLSAGCSLSVLSDSEAPPGRPTDLDGNPGEHSEGSGESEQETEQQGGCELWDPVEGVIDMSGFSEFTMDRRGVAADCASEIAYGRYDQHQWFVHIWKGENGKYLLEYVVFTMEWEERGEEYEGRIIEVPIVERELADCELESLRSAFSAVRADPVRSGSTCEDVKTSCCTSFSWDDLVFTDRTPGMHGEEIYGIPFVLLQLRYGLLDDAAQPEVSLESLAGIYHDRRNFDAINLTISADGRYSWDHDGCDVSGTGEGRVVEEEGSLVLYSEDGGYGFPFCDVGCPEAGIVIEPMSADTFATVGLWSVVIWERGKVCPLCADWPGPPWVEPCD